MSKRNENLILSNKKGYKIDYDGNIINNKENLLNGFIDNRNYKAFSIKENKKVFNVLVHRLQAYQKYGDKMFEKGIVVRHLNGNSLDNSYDNIVIGTQSDNMMDIPKEIRIKKSSNANKIHNHNFIIEDRNKGMTYNELMTKYNISSRSTISYIVNKKISC